MPVRKQLQESVRSANEFFLKLVEKLMGFFIVIVQGQRLLNGMIHIGKFAVSHIYHRLQVIGLTNNGTVKFHPITVLQQHVTNDKRFLIPLHQVITVTFQE